MDVVTDLSSRAISFLSAYKEICNMLNFQDSTLEFESVNINIKGLFTTEVGPAQVDKAIKRASELFPGEANPADHSHLSRLFLVTEGIVVWAEYHEANFKDSFQSFYQLKQSNPAERFFWEIFLTDDLPWEWRQGFRRLLYEQPKSRLHLVEILNYMPYLVILALEKKVPDIALVHQYQIYLKDEVNMESKSYAPYWQNENIRKTALNFLLHDRELIKVLNSNDLTVPFELLFHDEMDEVLNFSKRRYNADNPRSVPRSPGGDKHNDPLVRARQMKLKGITFSGGGIRSATFGLGVLQKLAKLDVLREFDYISTVSGGGYIGSWWISWIKRLGSFKQVNKLLNPDISGDPLSEEVRPIRWLRMYSNYLAPATGIASTDSVTAGLTWLRNTLINQVLLVIMLCTLLAGISLIYELWNGAFVSAAFYSPVSVVSFAVVFLGIAAFFTGSAMKMYSTGHPKSQSRFSNKFIADALLVWGMISGLIISSWIAASRPETIADADLIFIAIGTTGFLAMLMVAVIGNYRKASNAKKTSIYLFWLIASSAVAGALGGYLLKPSWDLIAFIQTRDYCFEKFSGFPGQLAFIIGPPLILECFSLCVVVRMMLMGMLFPDERREWWGRMGAVMHKAMVAYMLLAFGALILPQMISVFTGPLISLAGGWLAIVLWAVRTAYSSASNPSKGKSVLKDILIKLAPYLFMIIFLLLGAFILEKLESVLGLSEPLDTPWQRLKYLLFVLGMGGLAWVISYRIGVNEFSLHHFYRNRLTRAYLGATRRRTERENTANDFTGFDNLDEMPVKDLLFKEGYKGPYPIINTAMNASTVSELDRQDRKAESFTFSPLYCGYDFSTTRAAAESKNGIFQYGYRETEKYSQQGGPGIGTAMAISGAAVNPNMGYHSSAPVAFLLTVFNVRLGRWMGNPRKKTFGRSDPKTGLAYLVYDLIGKSDIDNDYVCLSDGGHFDNMGIYELVRRRCNYILVCDAEEDEKSTCEGLANAIRRCRIDFGVQIQIDVDKIVNRNPLDGLVKQHTVKGTIWYPGDQNKPSGKIVYVKTALSGNEGVDVREYQMNNNKFPQESTGDQFFNESQFESYRRLGYHSISSIKQL